MRKIYFVALQIYIETLKSIQHREKEEEEDDEKKATEEINK